MVPERTSRDVKEMGPWARDGLSAVVISGAGARGAYEAGVLAELLPALFPEGLGNVMLLGTSAGAINATMWAQLAAPGRSLASVGETVCRFWEDLDVSKVYSPVAWTLLKRSLRLDWLGKVESLLDTAPSRAQSRKTLEPHAIARNLKEGSVAGVGVVTTTCPHDGSGGRSRIFFQSTRVRAPLVEEGSGLDFVEASLTHEHVLASAAIPGLFPAVHVSTPNSATGWYTDGGLRLNTPIRPALDLGARQLVVVSSHDTSHPPPTPLDNEQPDVVDLTAQAMHAALADGMLEDLRELRRINALVLQASERGVELMNYTAQPPRPYSYLPLVTVSPRPGALARLAHHVLSGAPPLSPRRFYRRLEYQALRRAYAGLGRGPGNDELLSYLLFDPEFATRQVARGREDARAAFNDLRRQGLLPPGATVSPTKPTAQA